MIRSTRTLTLANPRLGSRKFLALSCETFHDHRRRGRLAIGSDGSREVRLHPLLPALLLFGFGVLIAAGMLFGPSLFAPKRKTQVKDMPYESGMDPIGDARGRFDVRFYLVAIVFLMFDVELLFLYPWAVAAWNVDAGLPAAVRHGDIAGTAPVFFEVMLFIGLLGLAYAYAWRRGVFRWK